VRVPRGVEVVAQDVLQLNSFALTPEDMKTVLDAVLATLALSGKDSVDGVVITHGTDTLEETAFLVDLFVDDQRPVVFTGAQRGADADDSDGPANIRDALTVAAAEKSRGLGTAVVFDGAIFPAWGTRKAHTLASAAFSTPDGGPAGSIDKGNVRIGVSARRHLPPLDHRLLDLSNARVDIIATYPGCDSAALNAVAAAGAKGVVLEATGAGNANSGICNTVERLTEAGVVVLLSTRVPAGPVVPIYSGGGGGVDLIAAGAISAGVLRPSQARMLLIALLGTGASSDEISGAFAAG
jgi:L-asparaginase